MARLPSLPPSLPPFPADPGVPVTLRIAGLTVRAASAIEARRLVEALPAALARAVEDWRSGARAARSGTGGRVERRADAVATEVLAAVARGLGQSGGRP